MGLTKAPPHRTANYLPYTSSEKAALARRYTPAQLVAIEAGESSIDVHDLSTQAAVRRDPMSLNYIDDFATIRPLVDHPVRAPESNYDPNLRFKTEDELAEDLTTWVENLPDDADRVEWMKFEDSLRLTVGKEEAELNPRSALAPKIPVLRDPTIRYETDAENGEEAEPYVMRLMKTTNYDRDEIRRLRVKVLLVKRVVNVTRLGKISRLYYLTVAGNGKGLLGIGEGKADEPEAAREQATMAAIRGMVPIPRYEGRTIFGDVKAKVGAVELELFTRPPGFGIRCQQHIFEMCRCAGISDLAARSTRARNPMNTVKATMQALLSQRLPEDIARARGKKLVDVRKVYYAGNV